MPRLLALVFALLIVVACTAPDDCKNTFLWWDGHELTAHECEPTSSALCGVQIPILHGVPQPVSSKGGK